MQPHKITGQLRQQLSTLFRPDYQQYPCCRSNRFHYSHRLDYPLVIWYTTAIYRLLKDGSQVPSQLETWWFKLFAWLVVYLLFIAMQAVMFKIWILPLVIPPAISFFSPCYLVVKRKVIPPATSFLTPYYLVVKREVRLVSSVQSLPLSGQAF